MPAPWMKKNLNYVFFLISLCFCIVFLADLFSFLLKRRVLLQLKHKGLESLTQSITWLNGSKNSRFIHVETLCL